MFAMGVNMCRLTRTRGPLQVFDESNSPYTPANQAMYAANAPSGGLSSADFGEYLKASS